MLRLQIFSNLFIVQSKGVGEVGEQDIEQRFKDFKDEILRAIGGLSDRITELSGEVKAYVNMAQQQDKQLVNHETRLGAVERANEEYGKTAENHSIAINTLQTELQTTRRNMTTMFTVVGLLVTLVSLVIKFWPN
jgi:DNA repair ATPase RecN